MELTKVGVKKRKITIQPSSREIMKESIILTTDLLSAHLRVEISFHQMRTGTTVHTYQGRPVAPSSEIQLRAF